MEIDFHYGATYAVARIAGFGHDDAQIVATASQYVDDTVNSGPVQFKSGQAYNRISTAHDFGDYHIALPVSERQTWVPFHFLPGNDPTGDHSEQFFNRMVCRPHSEIARAMAARAIDRRSAPHALHRLGITAHVFIDTWAHQGFAGIRHVINRASEITLHEPAEKHGVRHFWKLFREGQLKAVLHELTRRVMLWFTSRVFPMGHGAVLHYPDHPFRRWSYLNGHGVRVDRDNPTDFLEALEQLCRVFRRFRAGIPEAEVPGLPASDRTKVQQLIVGLTMEDPHLRLAEWIEAIRRGEFSFGPAQPVYVKAGEGSWKHAALGLHTAEVGEGETFEFTADFMSSHWKLFHDAVQAHQYDILREILPAAGIAAI